MKNKETTTEETETKDLRLFTEEGSAEIPQEASKTLLGIFLKERKSSVKFLNESAEHLLNLAESLADSSQEKPNQKPSQYQVEMQVKCLLGANDIMKTKLDYIKFGRELITGRVK